MADGRTRLRWKVGPRSYVERFVGQVVRKVKKNAYELELDRMRPLVAARSGGKCEARLADCKAKATDVHHLRSRKRGGLNALENLLDCCRHCHSWIHRNPLLATKAGLMLASTR